MISLAVSDGVIYAGTTAGLSISNDGGSSWINYTTENGIGSNIVKCITVINSKIYVGTTNGIAVSQ